MRVAVLGTGTMGAPMARNIAAAGHEVRAWNRSRGRAEPLAADGVQVAGSPDEAAAGAEVVVTMLSDGDAVEAVAAELSFPEDAVWAQMSTVGIEATERLLARAAGAGVPLVDAPVLGTKAPAEQGTLIVIASGDARARERCAPLFDAVGARTVALGEEPGASTRMKLVLNAWLVSLVEGLAESVALAEGLGVDPAGFLEIIDGGPLGPAYAKMKGTMMIERSYEPSFSLALAAKDARLALDAADASGLDLPALRAIRAQLEKAVEQGHGDADMAAAVEASRPG
ncbi:MAG TPA: NAD(P)-dependent oxidoreductase [Solirubrobacteraceae bacterium]|jgi:3-hydroxyisobutyrate dehydrogenase|nr:NAD(P)-dependent oxidoreductase [Solirubrobacteraceae bacterium]